MGCWNGTCGLSKLPILYGQKCKLIFLLNDNTGQELGGGFCYPTDLRMIHSFPLSGTYNYYGCLEKIEENWYSKFFLESFIKDVENGDIKIKSKESGGKSPIKSLEKVVNAVERGLVTKKHIQYTKDGKGNDIFIPMTFMLILEDVYNSAINIMKEYKSGYESKWVHDKISESMTTIDETFGLIKEGKVYSTSYYLIYQACGIYGGEDLRTSMDKKELVDRVIKDEAVDELKEIVKNFLYLHKFMYWTRTPYLEGFGAGAQHNEYKIYTKFFKSLVKYIPTAEKHFKD